MVVSGEGHLDLFALLRRWNGFDADGCGFNVNRLMLLLLNEIEKTLQIRMSHWLSGIGWILKKGLITPVKSEQSKDLLTDNLGATTVAVYRTVVDALVAAPCDPI